MLFLIATTAAHADITLIKLLRPGRVELDGNGDYDKLIAAIEAELSLPLLIKSLPIKRARRELTLSSSLCIAPFSLEAHLRHVPDANRADFISGVPIDLISGHAVTVPTQPIIRSREELAGKQFALWWGIPKNIYFGSDVKVVTVNNEDKALQLLMAGRVDLAWGWLPDSPMHYEKMGYEPPNFDPNFSLVAETVGIVCKRSQEAAKFIQMSDEVIESMRADGRLKQLLSPYARIVGVDVPMPANDK